MVRLVLLKTTEMNSENKCTAYAEGFVPFEIMITFAYAGNTDGVILGAGVRIHVTIIIMLGTICEQ